MNGNSFILLTCNEWKEYSSSSIIGIYTDERILKDRIWSLFEDDEIEWKGNSITSLKYDVTKEWEDCYDDNEEYDEEFSIEEEIKKTFEEKKTEIYNNICNTSVDNLDINCTYIMIQEHILND